MSGDVWLGLAKSGGVGPWFGPGLPDLPVKGEPTMAIRITDDMMVLEIDNCVVAIARLSEHAAADAGTARGSSRLIPPSCSPRPGGYGIDNRRVGELIFGQPSAHGRTPRRTAMSNRLLGSTMALRS